MPKILNVENMGLKGINTDASPWSLDPGFITGGFNFRVATNYLETAGGYKVWSTSPPALIFPGYIIPVRTSTAEYWLVAGRTAVQSYDGANWTDISSAAGYVPIGVDQELDWTGCIIGQYPVINNPQTHPEYWGGSVAPIAPPSPALPLQPLPWDSTQDWAAVNQRCQVIRSHGSWMFALNLIDAGVEVPDGYRWSHPAASNSLPPTWDETDDNFLAGRANIGGDSGAILDGLGLRDDFAIYSENGISILYPAFESEFIWGKRELSATVGLLTTQCVVEVKGTHFFLADGDIVANNGNQLNSVAHNRIRRSLSSQIDATNYRRSYAVRNDAFKEIWFCIPENGESFPTLAYVYNYRDDSWAIRELPSTLDLSHANYGSESEPIQTWDTWTGTWAEQTSAWGTNLRSPLDDTVMAICRGTGIIHVLDPTDDRVNPVGTRLERLNFPLEGDNKVTTITRVYPRINGSQPMSIQFGSQDEAGGPVRWKTPVTFTPGVDRKIDVRTTGEFHTWRFESTGFGNWQMSGMTIEYEEAGMR